jgi:hypothetical protein
MSFRREFISGWASLEVSQIPKIVLIFSIVVIIILLRPYAKKTLLRPPGPNPRWLIGNPIPDHRQWSKFEEWRKIYGESHI